MSAWPRAREAHRYRAGEGWQQTGEVLAEEVPVAFLFNGEPYAVMLATPADLADFALGFARSEGILRDTAELRDLEIRSGLTGIEVDLAVEPACAARIRPALRALPGPSSCGLCGTRALEDAIRWPPPVGSVARTSSAAIQAGVAGLDAHQRLRAATGATHAAAWLGLDGRVLCVREDIGRHNALDKLIGAMLRSRLATDTGMLCVTSRASYEMVQKAASAGIEILVAMSAPTALAVKLAESAQLTLLAFAREGRHVLYTHAHRVVDRVAEAAWSQRAESAA